MSSLLLGKNRKILPGGDKILFPKFDYLPFIYFLSESILPNILWIEVKASKSINLPKVESHFLPIPCISDLATRQIQNP